MKSQKITSCLIAAIILAPLFGALVKGDAKAADGGESCLTVDEETLTAYRNKLPERADIPRSPLYTGAEYAVAVGMGEPIPEPEQKQEQKQEQKVNAEQPPKAAVRYELTDEERSLIERIVMSESGNTEPYEGQALIAQCLLDACELDNIRPFEAAYLYQYIAGNYEPNESVKKAVSDVFDKGELVTQEPVVFYYNPRLTLSRWHESQIFVTEVGRHRFFKKRS